MGREKTVKDDFRRLVDELPTKELHSDKRYLEYLQNMGDPVLSALLEVPEDDEPITPEENKIAKEAWQEHLRGEGISTEEAKRELLS